MLSTMTVNEIIRSYPEAVELFNRLGIDACCGGDVPLEEAARGAGYDAAELVLEIQRWSADAA